jgi:hypothetical protein
VTTTAQLIQRDGPVAGLFAAGTAAARDFADIYVLARRFGKDVLLARAAQIDVGFDVRVLADMMGGVFGRI